MNLQFLNVNGYDENKIILDTLMGLDTEMYGIGKIRPIKIKDYELFKNSYSMYILTNYEHLELDRNENLLNALIGANTYKHAVIRT